MCPRFSGFVPRVGSGSAIRLPTFHDEIWVTEERLVEKRSLLFHNGIALPRRPSLAVGVAVSLLFISLLRACRPPRLLLWRHLQLRAPPPPPPTLLPHRRLVVISPHRTLYPVQPNIHHIAASPCCPPASPTTLLRRPPSPRPPSTSRGTVNPLEAHESVHHRIWWASIPFRRAQPPRTCLLLERERRERWRNVRGETGRQRAMPLERYSIF